MLWGSVVLVILLSVFALVWMCERHRIDAKLSRFADREPIAVDQLVRKSFPDSGDLFEALKYWWERSAAVLRVDAGLLRSDDRFDGVLAPVAGFPSEDESVELGELIEDITSNSSGELKSVPVDTFGQCVQLLAVASRAGSASK